MHLISVNVGLPRLLAWRGETFKTAIFKTPVAGRIMLRTTNLDGDRQADLSVHGGANKAVYGYPSEHYAYWRKQLVEESLPWGSFGENFTTEGLLESTVRMGDEYRVGGAILRVTTPRLPCLKLEARFRREDMIPRFLRSGFSGFYFAVVEEGEVGAGDELALLHRDEPGVSIAELNRLYIHPSPEVDLIRRALGAKGLPEGWRERFQAKLEQPANSQSI